MENNKLIKFFISIFIIELFFFGIHNVFAYSVETHAFLTDEIVKFYNQKFPNQPIPDDLKNYLIDGSRREDNNPRYMNHFYDPVYNRGLTSPTLGTWQKSKDWAQDSENQNNLTYKVPATMASVLSAIQQKKLNLISDETNFTWEKAIRAWVNGDKEKAIFTLGHILHLIEDTSVPDHTRNDTHPKGSPYENYAAQFKLSNPDSSLAKGLSGKTPLIFNNLESYFDELAKYSNNNFYSNDSIGMQSGYKSPEPDRFEVLEDGRSYGIFQDKEFGDYPIIKAAGLFADRQDELLNRPLIMSAYWSHLSTKSIQYGAGVINLFFQEAEKAKNDPNFSKIQDKSFVAQVVEAGQKLIGNIGSAVNSTISALNNTISAAKDFLAGNDNFKPVGQVSLQEEGSEEEEGRSQSENVQLTGQPKDGEPQKSQKIEPQKIESQKRDSSKNIKQSQIVEEDEERQENLQQQNKQQTTSTQQQILQQTKTPTSTLATQTPSLKECKFADGNNQSPPHQGLIINEVAWMGMSPKAGETATQAANNEWIELKNISNIEVDLKGWQLTDQGEQIKINLASINGSKVIRPGQFILLERTSDDSVPNIITDLIYTGALSNTNEGLRLFDSQCNLVDEVLTTGSPSLWPAGDNVQKRTMERSPDLSWHTYNGTAQNSILGTPKRENSSPSVTTASGSSGGGGGASQQTTNNNQSSPAKILISEIQITGGTGQADNEFIELYNPNDSAIDLTVLPLKLHIKNSNGTDNHKPLAFINAIILAKGYFLIGPASGYTGTASLDATYSISSGNKLVNNGGAYISKSASADADILDKVGWGTQPTGGYEASPFTENPGANQSIQRKFQNNAFVDTDNNASDFEIQTCPSPKAQSRNCSATNQAPSAFFVYTPANPQAGNLITFNAASSSDPDGQIISYQWNFGNGQATTTQATTTYSYSTAGTYTIQLIVFDNQNASSTATSTAISVNASGANHLVISEIMAGAGTGHSNEEFIELYNPTNEAVGLNGWSLKRRISQSSTSTVNLVSNFSATSTVAAKSFFLIAHPDYLNYSTSTLPDFFYTNNSNPLAYDDDVVILYNQSGGIVDEVAYQNIEAGKSIERKAFNNNQCVTASGSNEFLGNGCDTDSATDFEIRNSPKPQNSSSFPEPRSAPTTPQNFSVQYSTSTMELIFNWQASQDYSGATSTLTYKITDISNASSTLSTIETASTTTKISINEIGRQYNFSLQAADREDLGSATSTSSSTVPSFFSGLYFYQDPRDNTKNLIEAYYNQYPFMPDLYYGPSNSSWKLLVFYLNSDAGKQSDIDAIPYRPNNLENVLAIKYKHCSGGSITQEKSLLLPDVNSRCGTEGGAQNITFDFNELEDNHFIIQTASSSQELNLNAQNYITAAYYSTSYINVGPIPYFRLVAVDKTKYYFNQSLNHQTPQLAGQINLSFEKNNSRIVLGWPKATDSDTLDSLLTYEIRYADSDNWQSVGNATGTTKIVNPGDNLSINIRAKDDFGNYSSILTTNWSYPQTTFYIAQTATTTWSDYFGYKDSNNNAYLNLQSITPQNDFQFNKVVLKIKHTQVNDSANLKLSVYPDNGGNQPNFSVQTSSTTITNISGINNQELAFSFSNPISVIANNKYWLVLEVESYTWPNTWTQWDRNRWQNAISENDPYPGGAAGKTTVNNSVYNSSVSINSNADWYMKIGLEP